VQVSTRVSIIDSLSPPFVIGLDVLRHCKCDVSFRENVLILRNTGVEESPEEVRARGKRQACWEWLDGREVVIWPFVRLNVRGDQSIVSRDVPCTHLMVCGSYPGDPVCGAPHGRGG
jgi:hypothetical protein